MNNNAQMPRSHSPRQNYLKYLTLDLNFTLVHRQEISGSILIGVSSSEFAFTK